MRRPDLGLHAASRLGSRCSTIVRARVILRRARTLRELSPADHVTADEFGSVQVGFANPITTDVIARMMQVDQLVPVGLVHHLWAIHRCTGGFEVAQPRVHTPLPNRRGERELADRLVALLDEKSDLWFNLQPPGCQEVDILLVHAEIGAFVIEAKAKPLRMFVHYDLESCEFTDDGKMRPPLKQAHWAMNKLRTFLGDVGIPRPPFMVAAAAFPRVRREEIVARFAPIGIAGRVMKMHFDAALLDDDLSSQEVLADRFRWISRHPGMQRPPQNPNDSIPSTRQIAELIEATTGRGSSIPGSTEPTKKPQFIAVPGKASKDSVVRYLKPAMRAPVVLRGHPGTGKTQALLDIAVAHAEAGRQVLFTCYNKVLASAIRSSLGVRGVPDSVRQHLLVADVGDIKAGLRPRGAIEDDLVEFEGTFGTICVDEAQDMNGSLVDFVEQLASPEAEWFFADGGGKSCTRCMASHLPRPRGNSKTRGSAESSSN